MKQELADFPQRGIADVAQVGYEQESDLPGCRTFIQDNLEQARSRLYLVLDDAGRAVGFSQLYPSYCSISMRPYYYLSDLYVEPSVRQQGIARQLMAYLIDLFEAEGAQRLTLDTATTNLPAQALYESLGYQREQVYLTYHRLLGA